MNKAIEIIQVAGINFIREDKMNQDCQFFLRVASYAPWTGDSTDCEMEYIAKLFFAIFENHLERVVEIYSIFHSEELEQFLNSEDCVKQKFSLLIITNVIGLVGP